MKKSISLCLVLLMALVVIARADVPQIINYQGRLTDNTGEPIVGHRNMVFTLYDDATEGTVLWSDTLLDVPLDSNGLFGVVFGGESAIPGETFDSPDVWLGIRLTVELNEISPRTKLASVAYSFQSLKADSSEFAASIANNSVTSSKIEDGAILLEDIGQNAATDGQIMKWNETASAWEAAEDNTGSSNWSVTDSVLYTNGYWGLMRGNASNYMYGDSIHTMINLGVACSSGIGWSDYSYLTIGGGLGHIAMGYYNTIGGGRDNELIDWWSTISGGSDNLIQGPGNVIGGGQNNGIDGGWSTISGGKDNYIQPSYSIIGGGIGNIVKGSYSAILCGYYDTIAPGANYSYLFGIGSKLTEDSTFMVDMPHVRIGDEATGYELPAEDGTSGQVMATDGSGQVSWADQSAGTSYYQRLTFDNVGSIATDKTQWLQMSQTLGIAAGRVNHFIVVKSFMRCYARNDYDESVKYRLMIGETGQEISYDEQELWWMYPHNSMLARITQSVEFYYEPSANERQNGFNLWIEMRLLGGPDDPPYHKAELIRIEVFGH